MDKKILDDKRYELMKNILECTQAELKSCASDFLIGHYGKDKIIETHEYIVAEGDIPVAIVAHMDTVHRLPVKELFYDKDSNVMWSPQGIGADDRAGIYSMFEIMGRGFKPTLILTTDEEIGGVGAAALAKDIKRITAKINFFIELDRRGSKDCVFYDCDNRDFEEYIESFGFETSMGSFSDISIICPAAGVAGVNLSIGYYNEHSTSEYLNITQMFDVIDKVCVILNEVKESDWFEYIPFSKAPYTGGVESWYNTSAFGYSSYSPSLKDTELCWGCLGNYPKDMMISFCEGDYCGECFAKLFTTCVDCQEVFEDRTKTHIVCNKCRKNY